MKKNKKPDPAQLRLWEDFTVAKDELTAALDRFAQTATALVSAGAMTAREVVKESKKVQKKSNVELRNRIMRVVREQARTKKLHWREIFGLVYRRLWDETGFNAMARAIAAGGKTRRIDVIESAGLLPKVLGIASAL